MKLAVIGVGLIGGSFALALKQAKVAAHVVGVGRSAANLKLALERGAIDSIAADPAAAARGADLVFLATPVSYYPRILSSMSLHSKAVVTDAGSTKRDVVAAARNALKEKIAQFVPGHPIAGAEKSGVAAATPGLFRNRRVILTPLPENPVSAVRTVEQAWESCGARIARMSAEEHDSVLAAVSHLPHVLAFALVHDIAARENAAQLFSYAAGGFRDFTRIASSHPEMWRDICIANRDRLLEEIDRYSKNLGSIRNIVEAADSAALEKLFTEARDARQRWLDGEFES
ncbi:MAG TPA: prephenate dehydrogenase/arogenate dehydrogenase family protein [Burkholderiales bacterium]|nr:prephenate dehydrogenase/arogenate dehydrogenase family protein [Burkholderiales bacterium]